MAQLVVPAGSFKEKCDVDVNRLLASRSLERLKLSPENPNVSGEIAGKVRDMVAWLSW